MSHAPLRLPVLAVSLFALAACHTPPHPAPLVGTDGFAVQYHGRLSASSAPLEPAEQECSTDAAAGRLLVRAQVVGVPRDRLEFLLVERRPQPGRPASSTRTENAERVSEAPAQAGPMPLQIPAIWFWSPCGMRVPRAKARDAFAELCASLGASQRRHHVEFRCDPGRTARVASVGHVSFVEGFRFASDRGVVVSEPEIGAAERGMSIALTPTATVAGHELDLRLRVRDVLALPSAHARLARGHGTVAPTPVLIQAPVFCDHVFEAKCRARGDDAFVLLAPDAVATGEVLLALVEVEDSRAR